MTSFHIIQKVPPIYCLSIDPERRARMEQRFHQLDLEPIFITPTLITDSNFLSRCGEVPDKRLYAVMLDHLRMIEEFYSTGCPYGIFCEDDIYLRRTIKKDFPFILNQIEHLKLEIILLGYLYQYSIHSSPLPILPRTYTFHTYPDDLWGAQMYLLSRDKAGTFLQKYTLEYAKQHPEIPFSPDWTLTKDSSRRAAIYPMLAVEEGVVKTDHPGQIAFHRQCMEVQYNPHDYV